jgi:hypothetical protein
MTAPTKPKARKRPRPVCPEALLYEDLKAALRGKGLSPSEYAQACRRAARRAGL